MLWAIAQVRIHGAVGYRSDNDSSGAVGYGSDKGSLVVWAIAQVRSPGTVSYSSGKVSLMRWAIV